ncbi:MAG TPA: CHAT domain-containing protein [Cyclobacteriaceae bacterium]|nr:CHAT domain-containing protein [Cyclobacteriaceae bacterium]
MKFRTYILFLCLVVAASITAPAQNSIRALRKLANSRNPEDVREGILKFSEKAKAKNNFRQSILFSMLLGDLYERTGDYVMAEKHFVEAVDEARKHFPEKGKKFGLAYYSSFQKTIFDPLDRLGYFYLGTGNLKKAEVLFQESRKLRGNFFAYRSIHRAHPVAGMGSLYYRKGEITKTYEYFNEAKQIVNRAMSTNYDYDNVNRLFLNDLVEICLALGKNEEALQYIDELSLASSGIGKFSSKISSRMEVARIFELKARYYLLQKDYNRSEEYLNRADWYNPSKVASSDVRLKIIKTRAMLEWTRGNTERATATFKNLVGEYRKHITDNFVAMSEYEKEKFYYSLKEDFDLFNAYAVDQTQSSNGLGEEMFNNVLNTKGLLLNATNKLKNKILESGDPILIAKLHEWEDDKSRLAAMYYEKTDAANITVMENRIDALEKEINLASGLFESKEKPLQWQDIKAALGQKDAAIEMLRVRLPDKKSGNFSVLSDSIVYAVMLLTQETPSPRLFIIPNGRALEKHFLPYYRNAIFSRIEDNLSYDQYWLPIRRELAGKDRLYVSPDGVYNQINLNTLRNPASGKYVIDEIKIIYLTKTSDVLQGVTVAPNKNAVLVGRPDYDLETIAKIEDHDKAAYGTRNVISDELETFKDQEFEDLPGTETEISIIEPILKKRTLAVSTFKGQDALEETVKSLAHPAILHIATHGFFVEDSASAISPMIRSGIILAGVKNTERAERQEDGVLTAYEATNLDLAGTSLVVLSACQTGLGEVRNGEGVYGLQRAIVVAGAQNLLMSLWKVDDTATADLMSSFYELWTGKDNPSAFREAQIKLRQKYPQPFYWGAFVMLGK